MNLDELIAQGGLAPAEPVKRNIKWKRVDEDGSTKEVAFDVFVKRHSAVSIQRATQNLQSEDGWPTLLAESLLFGPEAKQRMTLDQARDLVPELYGPLIAAVVDVNGLAPKAVAEKNSPPPKSSGTS